MFKCTEHVYRLDCFLDVCTREDAFVDEDLAQCFRQLLPSRLFAFELDGVLFRFLPACEYGW